MSTPVFDLEKIIARATQARLAEEGIQVPKSIRKDHLVPTSDHTLPKWAPTPPPGKDKCIKCGRMGKMQYGPFLDGLGCDMNSDCWLQRAERRMKKREVLMDTDRNDARLNELMQALRSDLGDYVIGLVRERDELLAALRALVNDPRNVTAGTNELENARSLLAPLKGSKEKA